MAALAPAAVEELRADREHGAGWLARRALETLVAGAREGTDSLALARALAGARPEIAAIAGAVGRVVACARAPEQVVEEGLALLARCERAPRSIAVLLEPDLQGTVLTHSASATVREALLHARPELVICTESEPLGEGRRLADELREGGLAVEQVEDPSAAAALARADLLLVGADTVFRDGSVVNKIGTRSLAAAARDAGVPVVVATETLKLAPGRARDPDSHLFDLTPPDLVTRVVTEEGVHAPAEVAALVDRTPFLREGFDLLELRTGD